jgi:GH15 family glucan-1,4-alpha-glucosidase
VPDRIDPAAALRQSRDFWRGWAGQIDYDGADRAQIVRTLIPLKALVHRSTGGMIAAATASLPERRGGDRNWDYRFCWLRDTTFTLQAFLRVGLREEATAWMAWVRRAIAGDPIDVQPAYAVDGGRLVLEWEAGWLAGFGGARPVRFGNGAFGQLQLDVYGEVMDALALADRAGLSLPSERPVARLLAGKLEDIWREPDAGIWESRGPLRHHVYSKAMCWVAFDRADALLSAESPDAGARYRRLAETVRAEVLREGFDPDRGAFTRAYDDRTLDVAVLRLALVGFIDACDPRMLATVEAIERELMSDGLLRRYATETTDDGVGGGEGAFLAASCWLADVYQLQGRGTDARRLIERVAATANDLGLLSEEVSLATGEMLGNIPQALSHVAYVNSLMRLAAAEQVDTAPRLRR